MKGLLLEAKKSKTYISTSNTYTQPSPLPSPNTVQLAFTSNLPMKTSSTGHPMTALPNLILGQNVILLQLSKEWKEYRYHTSYPLLQTGVCQNRSHIRPVPEKLEKTTSTPSIKGNEIPLPTTGHSSTTPKLPLKLKERRSETRINSCNMAPEHYTTQSRWVLKTPSCLSLSHVAVVVVMGKRMP